MTAPPPDVLADLNRLVSELEQRLDSSFAAHDAAIAQQALTAQENARLQNELVIARERQNASAEILRTIASTSGDAERALQHIAETCARLFDMPSVSIMLAENGEWTQTFRFGDSAQRVRAAVPLTTIRIGGPNLPGAVVAENRQIHLPDLDNVDPSMAHWPGPPHARAAGTRTMCGTPLRRDGQAIGVLIVYRDRLAPFTEEELALQQGFADQAVIAIENARLFNETREALERQTATADILKVIASSPSDVQPVFEAIAESAKRLAGGHTSTVTRVIGDMVHLAAYTRGSETAERELQGSFPTPLSAAGIHSRVARSGELAFRADMETEPDLTPAMKELARARGYRSILVVPMMREGVSIGTIGVTRRDPGPFSDNIIDLLRTFADQALIAIENARLFNETREALERQTATADILKVIASSPSDVQPVFEAIAASANRLVGGFSTAVHRVIDDVVHLVAFTPTNPESDSVLQALFPRHRSEVPSVALVQDGETAQFADAETADMHTMRLGRARGWRSVTFTPLMSKAGFIGFIACTRRETGLLADHHVELLRTFADQAVIAIENVRLFDEVQAKTRDLTEALTYQTGSGNILKVIASSPTEVGPVLKAIVDNACEVCDAYDAAVLLRDGDDLRFDAHHGPIPIGLEKWPINRHWTAGRAVLEKAPVHLHDLLADENADFSDGRELSRRMGHRSILSVPLLRENEAIGAIVLRRTEVHPFSDKQIDLLQTFADQAVIAIGNVRLFEQVQQRTRELAASLDDLRSAQDRLVQTEKLASLGQLTAGIAHEIKNPLNFVNNFAALSAELTDELNDVLRPAALDDKTREEVGELTGLLKNNLEKVVQHGKRADSIVKNMLLHSREGSGDHRPADINALIDESLNLAYHGARAEKPEFNVTLKRDFDPAAGTAEVFPQEITRVFLNLVSNGFYAVAKRKSEFGDPGYDPQLLAMTRNLGDSIEIRIRDNGTGIPAEVRDKMFNPFFTTKPAGEGTGLGLSMSHDIIVKQHGGIIEVETEPGRFTEFRIVLPRTGNSPNKNRG